MEELPRWKCFLLLDGEDMQRHFDQRQTGLVALARYVIVEERLHSSGSEHSLRTGTQYYIVHCAHMAV